MRNPFHLKNALETKSRRIRGEGDWLDFEESLLDEERGLLVERGGGVGARAGLLWAILVISFGLIFGRLYYLAAAQHEYYREIAEGNRLRIEYLAAPRGTVYDRYGEVIVGNKPGFELVASPLDLPALESEQARIIARVAEIVAMPSLEIKNLIAAEGIQLFQSVLVKQNLTREQALLLYEEAQNLPGFRVVSVPIRDYRTPPAFAHVVGYVGKINQQEYQDKASLGYLYNDALGKTGLEQIYETFLRGEFGQRQVEVDARGVVKKVFGEKAPQSGLNLLLNIDAGLEEKLASSLEARLSATGRRRAAAIALNPENGRVLALVSLPGFDNNLFAQGISQEDYQRLVDDKNQPLFNRAVRGVYPPGSTVKPLVALAALAEEVVNERTLIPDRGYLLVENIYGGPDYFFYGYNRRGLGLMNVRSAIALSSDIYFYVVGGGYEPLKIQGLGINKLAEYYRQFQLDKTLGIDLPGEARGLVPTPEWKAQAYASDPVASRWYLGNTYHVSIGQGDLLVSPLHILSWTAAISNSGKIYRPLIVDRIETDDQTVVKRFEPEVVGKLGIDEEYLRIVREGMRQTVTEGTARSLNVLSVPVAGKTGTAQFDAKNLSRTHAWFAGFAPFENPEIAIVVLIEDGGEGSTAAVPVAREVLDWWAKNRYNK